MIEARIKTRELTDEDLADSTACSEAEDVLPNSRISCCEGERSLELACVTSDIHTKPVTNTSGHEPRAADEIQSCNECAHQVVGAHHLWSRIWSECLEDVILGAVGQAVKQQVNTE